MPRNIFITAQHHGQRLSRRGSFSPRRWRSVASRGPRVPKGTTGIAAIINARLGPRSLSGSAGGVWHAVLCATGGLWFALRAEHQHSLRFILSPLPRLCRKQR